MQTHQLICHIAIYFFRSFNTTSCFFFLSHRNHIVSGIFALGDLCTTPSPRLVSLLKRTLPVSSTNEVRGKLIFNITPSGILSVFELCYDMTCVFLSLFIKTTIVAGGQITLGDMAAKNGVIHLIDKVSLWSLSVWFSSATLGLIYYKLHTSCLIVLSCKKCVVSQFYPKFQIKCKLTEEMILCEYAHTNAEQIHMRRLKKYATVVLFRC